MCIGRSQFSLILLGQRRPLTGCQERKPWWHEVRCMSCQFSRDSLEIDIEFGHPRSAGAMMNCAADHDAREPLQGAGKRAATPALSTMPLQVLIRNPQCLVTSRRPPPGPPQVPQMVAWWRLALPFSGKYLDGQKRFDAASPRTMSRCRLLDYHYTLEQACIGQGKLPFQSRGRIPGRI